MEEQDFSFPGRMKLESPDQEFVRQFLYVFADAGFMIPHDIIVINLAPAELPKQAPSFDLHIPIGIGSISNQLDSNRFSQYAAVVESIEIIPVHTLQKPLTSYMVSSTSIPFPLDWMICLPRSRNTTSTLATSVDKTWPSVLSPSQPQALIIYSC
jgi:hypothetical protein